MTEFIYRTQNSRDTCRHKHSSRCATRWNVCCDCLFGDMQLFIKLNPDLHLSPLLLGIAKSWCCPVCQGIDVEQDQRYRPHPRWTVAVIPRHPDFVYPDPDAETIVRGEGWRLSRSAKRYMRRVHSRGNEDYETPSYRLPTGMPRGSFRRRHALPPNTIRHHVAERARQLTLGQSSSTLIGFGAPTQSMRGNHWSSDIPPQTFVSVHRLTSLTAINAPSSYRTGNRTLPYLSLAHGGYHPSTIISPTAPAGSWAQVVSPRLTPRPTQPAVPQVKPRGRRERLASGSNHSTTPPAGSSADIAALERTWDHASPPDTASPVDDWTADPALAVAAPGSADLAGTARHAARLLDAFSRTSLPPVVVGITAVQKRLLTTVLTSVLTLTREIRVHAALANESLEPLPVAEDVALRPDSACVVCYARLADMVLMPCWHLTLCEVCCEEIQTRAVRAVMRCPVCRADVVNKAKIYRS